MNVRYPAILRAGETEQRQNAFTTRVVVMIFYAECVPTPIPEKINRDRDRCIKRSL